MNNSHPSSAKSNVLEKECQRLWQDISQQVYQPNEYDLNADILEINHSSKAERYQFIRKDFSIFGQCHYDFFDRITIKIDDKHISVTPIELAKLVFLLLAQNQKPSSSFITSVFNGICIFFSFMKEKPIEVHLGQSDYQEYFGLIFSFSPTLEGLGKRLSAPSFTNCVASLNLSASIKVYRSLHVPFTFDNLNKSAEIKLLNQVCLDVMGLTYQDYRSGGSFDFLGLEVGKHYIDHCANVFEDNLQLALALRKTHSSIETIWDGARVPETEANKSAIIGRILTGEGLDTIVRATKLGSSMVETLSNLLLEEFRRHYQDCAVLCSINKSQVISQIIQDANLPDRFDTYEFVRSMLMAEFVNDWSKPSESIFLEYASALKVDNSFLEGENVFKCTYIEFIDICRKSVIRSSTELPRSPDKLSAFIKEKFVKATFVTETLVGMDALRRFCFSVEASGCTLFLALTGWRRSELGFPMSSLTATINTEVLDNLYTPWRFSVNWKVPKTHGGAKINREVTSYAYQIAYMATQLNLSGSENPALYCAVLKRRSNEISRFQSADYIKQRVDSLWIDFIRNYILFNNFDVDEYPDLKELKYTLCEAIPVYEYFQDKNKTKILKLYREGALDEKTTKVLNDKLSNETKEFLKDKNNILITTVVKTISREVMMDLPYPTSHAFRHIWAEAVLTRYRGDIGKFLRANFKHMDARFFAAYLRGKEMKAVYRIAERTIINQIVRKYLRSAGDEYHNYAGGFRRFVTKAARMTKVITPNDQVELADKINRKIISIKPNRWVTCMLRSDNQHRAKCSEDGIPQRRNAAPEFCLGCMHADISEMNFKGIVISVKNDVMACRNDNLPVFIKAPHANTVRLALARVKELRKNSGKIDYDKYIDYLEESIEMAAINGLAET